MASFVRGPIFKGRPMTSRFSLLPIRTQILCALLVAIGALVALSVFVVVERWTTLGRLASLESLVGTATDISALVHELQKERGASALFLSSGGQQFRTELEAQRKASDSRRAALGASLDHLRALGGFSAFLDQIGPAETMLRALDERRAAISGLRLAAPDSFAFYTGGIGAMLGATYRMPLLAGDAELASAIFAYLALVQGKEQAGQERATGSGGFARGQFDAATYRRLIAVGVGQDTYFSVFRGVGEVGLVARFQRESEGAVRSEVEALRAAALDAGIAAAVPTERAGPWFRATTARIDQMKAIEDAAAENLRALAAARAAQAQTEFLTVLVLAGLASVAALLLGLTTLRSIRTTLHTLADSTARIADGQIEVPVPGRERRDELGALANAIDSIRNAGVSALRIKHALDNASANVMMADVSGVMIYTNRAIREMFRAAEADIRRHLPHFRADDLIGHNIGVMHKDPTIQERMLGGLTQSHRARIEVGPRRFVVVATPVFDETGRRLGTIAEWQDITQELAIQDEVGRLVQGAAVGDFTGRIGVEGKSGFMLKLSEDMNTLVGTAETALEAVVRYLSGLAQGELSSRIDGRFGGLFARIQADANQTAERLTGVVGHIVEASETIGSAAEEISAGTTDLANRTEEQASSLEQTAAAMEELSATVRNNADNAQQANQVAGQANEAARNGGKVAQEAIEAMKRIESSSVRISEIIGVIDEIAFQTNLLALNAAVEAARAGDAGRGFAVVAQEVRQLAQRSAQASREIKALILDSDSQVKTGVGLVQAAAGSLTTIVAGVNRLATVIAEIATASREQANGLDEVNISVAQMDEMTQKNAALVEETTAATQSLATQAGELRELVAFFKV